MNTLNINEMEQELQRTFKALGTLLELSGFTDPEDQVAANPPAAEVDLERIGMAVPVPLPPSYKQLLCLHDGIKNFYWIDAELLPAKYRLENPDFEKDWERPHMLFFIMGDDWNGVAFDTRTLRSDGEMQVQEYQDNQETTRWPSLSDFLVGYRSRVEEWVAQELADREQMDDD